jgi:hypothetical protein
LSRQARENCTYRFFAIFGPEKSFLISFLAGKVAIVFIILIRLKMAKISEAMIKMRIEISRHNKIINSSPRTLYISTG